MNFSIWRTAPPFGEAEMKNGVWTGAGLNPGELIYGREAGTWKHYTEVVNALDVDLWCISTEGLPTEAQVEAALNPPATNTAAAMQSIADAKTHAKLDQAIAAGDTQGALKLVQQLLQER